jgi:hypothetical protein
MVKKTKSASVHKNALTHGIYAQDIVLPWEIEQDFVDLYEGLRNELEPDGPAEEEAVLGIAGLYWKKRRLTIGSQLAYQALPDVSKAGESGWRGVGEYLQTTSDGMEIVREVLRNTAKAYVGTLQCACSSEIESGKTGRARASSRREPRWLCYVEEGIATWATD